MSSGDSTVVPSSAPEINKVDSSNHTESNENDNPTSSLLLPDPATDSIDETSDIILASDISSIDLQAQEQSMPPPLSTSESLDNISLGKEGIILDEEGWLKRDDARSAFEITSVRLANTDDLERSARKNPVSTDSLRVSLPEKGESGDSIINDDEKESSLEDSELKTTPKFVVDNVNTDDEADDIKEVNDATPQLLASPSNTNLLSDDMAKASTVTSHSILIPPTLGGMGTVPAVNGSGVQSSRFRRINQYDRARWTVRDSLVTEEQAMVPQNRVSAKQQDHENVPNGTPPRTHHQVPRDLQSFAELSLLPGIIGSGAPNDSTSDRDSFSIHMDRSSTAAETLSRNTSMSSIVAAEKSIDGDEVLRDVDEVVVNTAPTAAGGMGQEHEVLDVAQVSPQSPAVPTSSVGAIPPPSSTAVPREEPQHMPVASKEDMDFKRVEHAMSILQNELKEVLTSSSYSTLIEENRVLKDQHSSMDATNAKLRDELKQTKDELHLIKEDNTRLKKELAELRRSLSVLAQTSLYSANPSIPEESSLSVSTSHSASVAEQHQQVVTPAASSSSNNTSLDYPPYEST